MASSNFESTLANMLSLTTEREVHNALDAVIDRHVTLAITKNFSNNYAKLDRVFINKNIHDGVAELKTAVSSTLKSYTRLITGLTLEELPTWALKSAQLEAGSNSITAESTTTMTFPFKAAADVATNTTTGKTDFAAMAESLERTRMALRDFPEPYFFYGSLMDPETLGTVTRLVSTAAPVMRPASIVGYRVKMWSVYPALVPAAASDVVNGMMYVVPDAQAKERLATYETSHYREQVVDIRVSGEAAPVRGRTFVWNYNPDELEEGSFDLRVWRGEQGYDIDEDEVGEDGGGEDETPRKVRTEKAV